jgi:hypothetical protein
VLFRGRNNTDSGALSPEPALRQSAGSACAFHRPAARSVWPRTNDLGALDLSARSGADRVCDAGADQPDIRVIVTASRTGGLGTITRITADLYGVLSSTRLQTPTPRARTAPVCRPPDLAVTSCETAVPVSRVSGVVEESPPLAATRTRSLTGH